MVENNSEFQDYFGTDYERILKAVRNDYKDDIRRAVHLIQELNRVWWESDLDSKEISPALNEDLDKLDSKIGSLIELAKEFGAKHPELERDEVIRFD